MEFSGRSRLLERLGRSLEQARRRGSGQLLAVRGRRQVGKSTLFTRFVESADVPYLFFTAVKNAGTTAQLRALAQDATTSSRPLRDTEALFGTAPVDWRDAFGRIAVACRDTPSVVVLDEFPWAVETDPSLEGELQIAWDRRLSHLPVLVVLIGSDVAMMERVAEHDRPLYGRSGQMRVGPFDPAECAAALGPDASALEAFDAVLVTGGYPRLLVGCAEAGGAAAFVREQLADEHTDLVVMAQQSLAAEFPAEAQGRLVLSAIGGHEVGHATFSDVVGRSGASRSATQTMVSRALRLLVDVKQVVAVESPVGARPGTRLRRYRVADPYLRFWFRFVERHVADIARGRSDIAVRAFDRDWPTWRGKAVEPIVHDAVRRLAPGHPLLDGVSEVGGWWNRQHNPEYDLVAADAGGTRAVGTIKWRARKMIDAADLAALASARSSVPGAQTAALVAVSPAGVRPGVHFDLTLTPDDLLAAWR